MRRNPCARSFACTETATVPAGPEDMACDEDVVLITWKYPLLGERSEFNPCERLSKIDYWKGLEPTLDMPDGSMRRLRFLIWQDCCPVHGPTGPIALRNRNLIQRRAYDLDELFDQQAELSGQLMAAWASWLEDASPRRWLIVVAKDMQSLSRSRIAGLLGDRTDETLLVKANPGNRREIMRQTKRRLRQALGLGPASRW